MLDVSAVVLFHRATCNAFFESGVAPACPDRSPVWRVIAANHENNMRLWAEEDLARRTHVPAEEIVANKRAIDAYNQARNDAIEQIDDGLMLLLPPGAGTGRLSSETPGSMIDRLSIASLKFYHMSLQARRSDVWDEHREGCRRKAGRIAEQREDISDCLRILLDDCMAGRACFKTYRQFKMYNDPRLNMALVREARNMSGASLSTGLC